MPHCWTCPAISSHVADCAALAHAASWFTKSFVPGAAAVAAQYLT
jgi:hypothetical protein